MALQYDYVNDTYWDDGTGGSDYLFGGEGTNTTGFWDDLGGMIGSGWDAISGAFTDDSGDIDWGSIAGVGGALLGLSGLGSSTQPKVGYQGSIPSYSAVREKVPRTYDPTRRPGSAGQQYFSDTRFATPENVATARTEAQAEAEQRAQSNEANPAIQRKARGGLASLANTKGYYLGGVTDGMADKIPTTIGGKQPAALSDGEFVVPADVVSHLGNGNSNAGADQLYSMMDRVRQARTGTKKQGKQINPQKMMPK